MRIQKLIFVLPFLCSYITAFSQGYDRKNTYLDAIKFAKIYKAKDKAAFDAFLLEYGIKNESDWERNPFLENLNYLYHLTETKAGDNGIPETITKNDFKDLQPASSSPINFQAAAINGLATFMAGRFKQEVFQVSIDQFFKQVSKEKAQVVQGVFPKTFTYIDSFSASSKEINSYYGLDLVLLQESAQLDLNDLPKNIANNSEKIFPKLSEKPYGTDLLKSAYYVYDFTKRGESLDNFFSRLTSKDYNSPQIKNVLEIGDIISTALENEKGRAEVWINLSKIHPAKIHNNQSLEVRLFYGLLFEQLKTKIPMLEFQNESEISQKVFKIFQFISKLNSLEESISTKDFNIKTKEDAIFYLKEIGGTYSLFLDSISESGFFYDLLSDQNLLQLPEKYFNLLDIFLNEKYDRLIPFFLVEFKDNLDGNNSTYRSLYLISQFATVESSKDMENALQNYALPVGSSSIKRNSSFNVSINGYVGLTGGFETAFGNHKNQTRGNIGLAAPIGISTTFGQNFTVFLSVIDIGSVVNQRLGSDVTEYNNLKFEQFLTPGIGLYYNIKRLPLSLGLHINHISNLRNIEFKDGVATIEETNRSVQRINFSVLLDLPFFNIYTK